MGSNWSRISDSYKNINDVWFLNPRKGFIVVAYYDTCNWQGQYIFSNNYLYLTNDFGKTWQVINQLNLDNNSQLQFTNDSIGYISGYYAENYWHCSGPGYNHLYKTRDGGNNWEAINYGFSPSVISFINKDIGYIFPTLLKTINGGQTFDTLSTNLTVHPKQFLFINEIDGYLSKDDKIFKTISCGYKWIRDFIASSSINKLYNNKKKELFALGDNGLILKKPIIESITPDTIFNEITINAYTLNYGNVSVGSSTVRQFHILNNGDFKVEVTVSSKNDFRIGFSDIPDQFQLSFTLQPSGDTIIKVSFLPTLYQTYKDSLVIQATNLNTEYVKLEGVGVDGLSGEISRDTILCGDTIKIAGDLTIKETAKVTICPGSVVLVTGNYSVLIHGILKSNGTSNEMVSFIPKDTLTGWGGLKFENSSFTDTSFIKYSIIRNVKNPSGAIDLENSNLKISDSKIFNNSSAGIQINVSNCHIINCNIFKNSGSGIVSNNSTCYISYSYISNNYDFGIFDYNNRLLKILNNIISDNNVGISLNYGISAIIFNNSIFNNIICGIDITYGENKIIQNLIFNNSGEFGVLSIIGGKSYIINNTICNNQVVDPDGYTIAINSCDNVEILNNIIFNSDNTDFNPIIAFSTPNLIVKNNDIQGGYFSDSTNINKNPGFVNPTRSIGKIKEIGNYDWSLKRKSPCINSGITQPDSLTPQFDFAGNPRIYNNDRIDIGAYEFQGIRDTSSNSIEIFPNPTNNYLRLSTDLNSYQNITLKMYDNFGRIIKSEIIVNNETIINLSEFNRGIYYLRIYSNNDILFKRKVIKY
jgi:hypothetical protein